MKNLKSKIFALLICFTILLTSNISSQIRLHHDLGLQLSYANEKYEGPLSKSGIGIPHLGIKYKGSLMVTDHIAISVHPNIGVLFIPGAIFSYQIQVPVALEYWIGDIDNRAIAIGCGINYSKRDTGYFGATPIPGTIYGPEISIGGKLPIAKSHFGFRASYVKGTNVAYSETSSIRPRSDFDRYDNNEMFTGALFYLF